MEITINVLDTSGDPIADASVNLKDQAKKPYQFTLTADHPDYKPFSMMFHDLDDIAPEFIIVLTPK